MNYRLVAAGLVAGLSLCGSASATVFIVGSQPDSLDSGAGIGLPTISLAAGDLFSVSAGLDDLWSAGPLPRWSNADGLTGDLFATGTDESGEAAGTLIGTNFGTLDVLGFSAPYGSLVGRIGLGPGAFRLLGTSFAGPAWATGTLVLYYWDTFTPDNTGSVAVDITTPAAVIPEPAAWALMILGFGLAGAALRRRRSLSAV